MNKQEALQKIKELEQYIKDCDSKITDDMIVPGAYFNWNGSKEPVTLIFDITDKLWYIGGVYGNPFSLYNHPGRTMEQMLDYLRKDDSYGGGGYVFVGVREFTVMK